MWKKWLREYKISCNINDVGDVENLEKIEYFSSKKERRDVNINKDLYANLLWFKFFHKGKLEQLGWNLWESCIRFNFKLRHVYNREQVKNYFLTVNYKAWLLSDMSILVEWIDYTKSWQKIIAWLDISPWFKENFTWEYEYDSISNSLILKTVFKWASRFDVEEIRNMQDNDTLEILDSNYFIMTEKIEQWTDWLLKISDMQNHFNIISIPSKLQ